MCATVELVGLPGAGKTSVLRTIGDRKDVRLSIDGQYVSRPSGNLIHNFTYWRHVAAHFVKYGPSYISFVVAASLHTRTPRRCVARTIKLARLIAALTRREQGRSNMGALPPMIVLDQGVCQGIWSLYAMSKLPDLSHLSRQFKRLGFALPASVIIVSADPKEAARRVKLRNKPGCEYAALSNGRLEYTFAEQYMFFDQMLPKLLAHLGIRCARISV